MCMCGEGAVVGKSDLLISVWRALVPCDRSGRGGASPAGSTERQACQKAACRTPAERRRQRTTIKAAPLGCSTTHVSTDTTNGRMLCWKIGTSMKAYS